MPNSFTPTAENLSRIGSTVLQPMLAPLAKIARFFPLEPERGELPGLTSQVALATVAPATQTGNTVDFNIGDSTLAAINVPMEMYVQAFGISSYNLSGGRQFAWLAEINARQFAATLWDVVASKFTTGNFGAPVATVAANAFAVGDFETMFAAVPSAERAVVLDSPYFCKVKPLGWFPPSFDACFESNRWSAAGEKVRGVVASPHALVCRWDFPQLAPQGVNLISRDVLTLPAIGMAVESSLWIIPATRSYRGAFAVYFGCAVGDATALKLLSSG